MTRTLATPALAVFDFDGTLVDSEPGIVRCIAQTVAALGLPATAVAAWRDLIGLPLAAQLAQVLPPARHGEIDAGVALYRSFWFQLPEDEMGVPFPGVRELISALARRLPLAIATSKGRRGVLRVLEREGWTACFDPVLTPDDVDRPKPDPESLLRACAQRRVPPAAAVYVGDSRFDMEMATRAGVTGWGVTWGLHDAATLTAAGARACFSTPAALGAALGADR